MFCNALLIHYRISWGNVPAIKEIMDQAGRRDYTVKVYPNGSHNLIEVPPDDLNEQVRLKGFPPGLFETMVDWTTTQLRRHGPANKFLNPRSG
jgi:hypothetical protein